MDPPMNIIIPTTAIGIATQWCGSEFWSPQVQSPDTAVKAPWRRACSQRQVAENKQITRGQQGSCKSNQQEHFHRLVPEHLTDFAVIEEKEDLERDRTGKHHRE